MRSKASWLQQAPFHPFLLAAYPIVALLAVNVSEVELTSALRPLLLSVLLAGVLLWLCYAIFRDWRRAAFLATILLLLFFSYGHVYILLKGVNVGGVYLFRHRTLVPLWLGLAALGGWWASRKSLNLTAPTYAWNVVGLFLLIFPVVQLISFS